MRARPMGAVPTWHWGARAPVPTTRQSAPSNVAGYQQRTAGGYGAGVCLAEPAAAARDAEFAGDAVPGPARVSLLLH